VQPSPEFLFPSSHCSPTFSTPSPQEPLHSGQSKGGRHSRRASGTSSAASPSPGPASPSPGPGTLPLASPPLWRNGLDTPQPDTTRARARAANRIFFILCPAPGIPPGGPILLVLRAHTEPESHGRSTLRHHAARRYTERGTLALGRGQAEDCAPAGRLRDSL